MKTKRKVKSKKVSKNFSGETTLKQLPDNAYFKTVGKDGMFFFHKKTKHPAKQISHTEKTEDIHILQTIYVIMKKMIRYPLNKNLFMCRRQPLKIQFIQEDCHTNN